MLRSPVRDTSGDGDTLPRVSSMRASRRGGKGRHAVVKEVNVLGWAPEGSEELKELPGEFAAEVTARSEEQDEDKAAR